MVQEVQTWVWINNETTLETIEAIGTSSFRIVEWRQTKGYHYTSWCTSSWSVSREYHSWDSRDSWMVKWSLSINNSNGKQEFSERNGWIRVPSAWTYQLTINRDGGSSTYSVTIYVMSGGNTIYTKKFNSYNSETVTLNADLWKFDIIELRWNVYYAWSATVASLGLDATIDIQQL